MDRFTADHLQGVSRTYALVIPMLPGELAETVGLSYLLMRIVDTLEDCQGLSDAARLERLDELDTVLSDPTLPVPTRLTQPIGDTDAEVHLMCDTATVIERLRGSDPVYRTAAFDGAREMIRGVRLFSARAQERGRPYPAIETPAETREYCYYVAGVVGILLNRMMAHYLRMERLNSLHDLAVELGIGLQLVNVLKDALKDSADGRRYLPPARDGELTHHEIYRFALCEARASLRRGLEFVLALPAHARGLRCFCGLPIAWGAMTLANAEQDASRAKIGRQAITSSITRFRAIAGDDHALRRWIHDLIPPTDVGDRRLA